MIIIGVDEAGYGPNLGPLVISGSVWCFDPTDNQTENVKTEHFAERLIANGVFSEVQADITNGRAILLIGDSKRLYKSGDSLDRLERTVLTVYHHLARLQHPKGVNSGKMTDFQIVENMLTTSCSNRLFHPWEENFQYSIPDIEDRSLERLETALGQSITRLLDLRSLVIYPEQFNESVARLDSKGTAHAHFVLQAIKRLIKRLLKRELDENILIVCDKLGARNRYSGLLYEFFDGTLIETVTEGAEKSEYRFIHDGIPVTIRFQVKGESLFPVALASLASKYLRELAMKRWNQFWREQIPELTPTAGYPEDARRFLGEIEQVQKQLGIATSQFWRNK